MDVFQVIKESHHLSSIQDQVERIKKTLSCFGNPHDYREWQIVPVGQALPGGSPS